LPQRFDCRDVLLKLEFRPALAQAVSLGDAVGVEIFWRFFVMTVMVADG
jgi:hypothetical protein